MGILLNFVATRETLSRQSYKAISRAQLKFCHNNRNFVTTIERQHNMLQEMNGLEEQLRMPRHRNCLLRHKTKLKAKNYVVT